MMLKYSALFVISVLVLVIINIGCGQSMSRSYAFSSSGKQGWLGVEVQDVTYSLKERKDLTVDEGAYVGSVTEESPAEQAGIEKGDVIVKFDGKTIDDSNDLIKVVRRTKPKTEVKIDLVRKAERKTVSATLSRAPALQAYSFNFNGDNLKIPRTPFHMHMFSSDDLYGLQVQSLTKQLGEYFDAPNGKGVLVAEVKKGSDAEKSGFKAGDVITKVNGSTVRNIDDLREELSDNRDKENSFEVVRKGKPISLSMKLTDENEDEDEDDDDYSGVLAIPQPHHMGTLHLDMPRVDDLHMHHLKEDLRKMREQLKEQIQRLKESLREELREL